LIYLGIFVFWTAAHHYNSRVYLRIVRY